MESLSAKKIFLMNVKASRVPTAGRASKIHFLRGKMSENLKKKKKTFSDC